MPAWEAVAASIGRATGRPFTPLHADAAGGGSINRGYRLADGKRVFFVKVNQPGRAEMFEAEALGLQALAATRTLRVPEPVCWDQDAQASWLVLEHLDLRPPGERDMAKLGRGLAGLHACSVERFGWQRDNTIGSTPQANGWMDDWAAFWRERRLRPQLALAAGNGYSGALQQRGEALAANLERLLAGHAPRASLLHGDLWGGNAACTASAEPVAYDPACYHGDREADLAMTELFGGFSAAFYTAYAQALPLEAGYPVRRDLYNLYHVLNHLNLFGGGYLAHATRLIDRLLSEVR
jgi:fructosamine-3-kinase